MWFNLLKGSVSTLLRRHCKGQGKKQRDYKRLIQVACWGHSTGEDHKRLNSECILEVEPTGLLLDQIGFIGLEKE